MLFNTLVFPIFLVLVLAVHWTLPRNRHRQIVLLLASYVFYGWWDWRFLSLLLVSSAVDFLAGRWMGGLSLERRRTRIAALAISLIVNLSILGAFKYFGFFAESLGAVLRSLGLGADWPTLHLVLPVGISFYTFQTLSYTIDVYRGRCPVCRDPVAFFLFVAFFPQLVAGPIERGRDLVPQLAGRRSFDPALAASGVRCIVWGYFLKTVLADNLAVLVDGVYGEPAARTSLDLLVATYGFAFQIYGDFAGYSYIAIGTAALFGVRLSQNFRSPYLSRDVREFWTRWHMSLSRWFREYVYIWVLGGNRVSRRRRFVNVLLTFTLSGLWHGANWTFVLWGLLNGLFYHLPRPLRGDRPAASIASWFVAFHLVCLGWVFFRAPSIVDAFRILGRIAAASPGLTTGRGELAVAGLATGLVVACEIVQRRATDTVQIERFGPVARFAFGYVLLLGIFFLGRFDRTPFLYFRF